MPDVASPAVPRELARRLEAIEAEGGRAFVDALARRRPDVAIEPIAGGWAVFAGPGSPMTEAKGLAMDGPIGEADLDRLAAFFLDRGVTARVSVCPMVDRSLVEGLGRRGFRAAEFESVLARPLAEVETPPVNPGVAVRPAGPGDANLYRDVAMANFFDPANLPPEIVELNDAVFRVEGVHPFLAYLGDEPVGGGSLMVHEGVALLAGAGTLPPYRNRGVQRALQVARLDLARQLGCDLLVQMVEPGGASQRNAERLGLRVQYTKVILVRDPA
jgi:GNAT superfamily N-acetyltransferase